MVFGFSCIIDKPQAVKCQFAKFKPLCSRVKSDSVRRAWAHMGSYCTVGKAQGTRRWISMPGASQLVRYEMMRSELEARWLFSEKLSFMVLKCSGFSLLLLLLLFLFCFLSQTQTFPVSFCKVRLSLHVTPSLCYSVLIFFSFSFLLMPLLLRLKSILVTCTRNMLPGLFFALRS